MHGTERILAENRIFGVEAELFRLIAEDGAVRCSKREFAERLGISEMTVFRHLKNLSSKGLVEISGYGGQARTYRIPAGLDTEQSEIDELRAEVAELKALVESLEKTISDHNKTITDHNSSLARDNSSLLYKGENGNKATVTMVGKDKTEAERAAEDDHNTDAPWSGMRSEAVFDEIWERIDWLQKARYRQTRDVQWRYAEKPLEAILEKVSADTLLDRIRSIAGDGMSFGKPVSYWLKDNIDILSAREADMGWHKLGSSAYRDTGMRSEPIRKAG